MASDAFAVPTDPERDGDFSAGSAFAGVLTDQAVADALNSRSGCSVAVANAGGAPIAAGTRYSDIFPGNVIPAECFDSTAADLLSQFVPGSNLLGDQYRGKARASGRFDQVTARIDHNITNQQRLNAYYYFNGVNSSDPFSRFQGSGSNVPGFGTETEERFQQLAIAHEWAIDANTNNELRLAYFRQGQGKLMAPQRTNVVQESCSTVPSARCFADPGNPLI